MNKKNLTIRYTLLIALAGLFTPLKPYTTDLGTKTQVAIAGGVVTSAIALKKYVDYCAFRSLAQWDWKKIGTDDGFTPNTDFFTSDAFKKEFPTRALPAGFHNGGGDSALQSEGGITRSTYNHPMCAERYAVMQGAVNNDWAPEEFAKKIELIKALNQNAHRNNIEWSRIQPTPDFIDMEVLNEYARRYAELIKNGITPFIGFHHYSDPVWFMWPDENTEPIQKQMKPVGFESKENIKYYINFCVTAFTVINDACQKALDELNLTDIERALREPRWLTFNSPGSYALNGYLTGDRPPFIRNNMNRALNVMENMLNAHDEVYREIKKIYPKALIGTTHNIYQADPFYPEKGFFPVKLAKYLGNFIASKVANTLSNSAVCHYFTDRQVTVYAFKGSKNALSYFSALWNRFFFNKKQRTLDFICINYYSHGYMKKFGSPEPATDELKTSNNRYTIYAEGLYRAIKEVYERVAQPLDIPIYITENGFSQNDIVDKDGKPVDGEERRKLFLNRHFYAIAKAIKDGYPVKGYMYWSLNDNCEWADGFKKNYGLATRDKVIKPSGHYYAQIVAQLTA